MGGRHEELHAGIITLIMSARIKAVGTSHEADGRDVEGKSSRLKVTHVAGGNGKGAEQVAVDQKTEGRRFAGAQSGTWVAVGIGVATGRECVIAMKKYAASSR